MTIPFMSAGAFLLITFGLATAIWDEERRQSEALGYRVILRGPQLVEAINRRAG